MLGLFKKRFVPLYFNQTIPLMKAPYWPQNSCLKVANIRKHDEYFQLNFIDRFYSFLLIPARTKNITMEGIMTQGEFTKQSNEFVAASDEIGDNWQIVKKENHPEYIVCHRKIDANQQLFHFEYHVAYSVSYQVPVLYFKITKEDGSNVSLDEVWDIFKNCSNSADQSNMDMHKILTQMEHPQLFIPFFALHPCRTAELLALNSNSKNQILTFLSSMGPFIHLNLDPIYGKMFV